MDIINTYLGKYKILRKLGSGGMAEVYLAEDEILHRKVALKLLTPEISKDHEKIIRFQKEVRHSAALKHANIITIYDVGEDKGFHYYTMEYLPNGDLKSRIHHGLSENECIEILKEIADALGYAHKQGLIHRDIKPENIMFNEHNQAVLTDLGISKAIGSETRMTKVGISVGTPHYMSPEQARGKEIDHRTDLYSLGVVFYEMLTGNVPYDAEDSIAVAYCHVNEPVPVLPEHFSKYQPILDKLLAKDISHRYSDAYHLIDDLNLVSSGKSLKKKNSDTRTMSQKELPTKNTKESKNSGNKMIIIATSMLLLAAVVGWLVYSNLSKSPSNNNKLSSSGVVEKNKNYETKVVVKNEIKKEINTKKIELPKKIKKDNVQDKKKDFLSDIEEEVARKKAEEKRRQEEIEKKRKLIAKKIKEYEKAFNKAESLCNEDIDDNMKIEVWSRYIEKYSNDIEDTDKDNELLREAKKRLALLQKEERLKQVKEAYNNILKEVKNNKDIDFQINKWTDFINEYSVDIPDTKEDDKLIDYANKVLNDLQVNKKLLQMKGDFQEVMDKIKSLTKNSEKIVLLTSFKEKYGVDIKGTLEDNKLIKKIENEISIIGKKERLVAMKSEYENTLSKVKSEKSTKNKILILSAFLKKYSNDIQGIKDDDKLIKKVKQEITSLNKKLLLEQMKKDYNSAVNEINLTADVGEKIQIWKDFLKNYNKDIPNTTKDDQLRQSVKNKIESLTYKQALNNMKKDYNSVLNKLNLTQDKQSRINILTAFLQRYSEDIKGTDEDNNLIEEVNKNLKILKKEKAIEDIKDEYIIVLKQSNKNDKTAQLQAWQNFVKKYSNDISNIPEGKQIIKDAKNAISKLNVEIEVDNMKSDYDYALNKVKYIKDYGRKIEIWQNFVNKYRYKDIKETDEDNDLIRFAENEIAKLRKLKKATYKEPNTGMEFVRVKGGCYEMGDLFGDGDEDEYPIHKVCVDDFYIGKYEVTNEQFRKFRAAHNSNREGEENFNNNRQPVVLIAWNDAKEFANWLSKKTGKNFRLPTEAEWEYAARSGGKKEKYSGDNDINKVAWYFNNSRHTNIVGQKKPNGLGIYDMSGNVWEFCEDKYNKNAYSKHHKENPIYAGFSITRVKRGGGWSNPLWFSRTFNRDHILPVSKYDFVGFRLVMEADK
jgi:serine/threonine protein kinase/formylglycine-generating enzyme required for sulfatase activity